MCCYVMLYECCYVMLYERGTNQAFQVFQPRVPVHPGKRDIRECFADAV
jgi:intergrase/recombinase